VNLWKWLPGAVCLLSAVMFEMIGNNYLLAGTGEVVLKFL